MKLMATFGALRPMRNERHSDWSLKEMADPIIVSYNYSEPFYNHFQYCHQVDNHSSLRHSPILLKESI
jgi:hypothetical protein